MAYLPAYDHGFEGSPKWFNNQLKGWAFQFKRAQEKVQAAANGCEADKALAKSNLENLEEKKKLMDDQQNESRVGSGGA